MKIQSHIKVIKETKTLRIGANRIGTLGPGDIAEIVTNSSIGSAQVSTWGGKIKITPATAQQLVNGGYAEYTEAPSE